MGDTERFATLRQKLVEHLSRDDVHAACLDLGLRFDDFSEGGLSSKISQLLETATRLGRVRELVAWCAKQYPDVPWADYVDVDAHNSNAQSPFKGLAFYDVADADLFVGREHLTAELIAKLKGTRFLAVTGASGSGKSSLVRAGVVATLQSTKPLVKGDLPDGCHDWLYHILTPTDNPLKALAVSLIPEPGKAVEADQLARGFLESDQLLDTVARQLVRGSKRRLLLVVDQFEELFTACKDKAQRKAFVDNLLYAASGEHDGPAIVLLTLRADFYAQCFDFDNLREALGQHQAPIGPMSADDLRRSMVEPALRSELDFEPGLVDLLLRDVGDEPGALPLLSHALLETWKRRDGRVLTLAGYQASGGVRGAIAKTADSTLAKLTEAQQAIARRIFVGLTELGEGAQDTRRRAPLSELARTPAEADAVTAVLRTLADARLVTTDRDDKDAELAEVAHEALIREWPALRKWLEQDRAGERIRRQLAEDAREWLRLNRDDGALYRGARLAQAAEWAEANANLAAESHEFLEASKAAIAREAEEREAQQQRELAAAQKLAETEAAHVKAQRHANARLRARNIVLAVTTVVTFGLAIVALAARQDAVANAARAEAARQLADHNAFEAQYQAQVAQARQLSAQAAAVAVRNPARGLLLGVEAYRTVPVPEMLAGLLSILQPNLKTVAATPGHEALVHSIAFSPSGKAFASAGSDNAIRLWDISDPKQPKPLGEPMRGHEGSVQSVAFSPDGKILASGSTDKTVRLWDVSDPKQPKPLGEPMRGHEGSVQSVAFSHDGKTLASGSTDKTVRLWDVSDPGKLKLLGVPMSGHGDSVQSIAFNPDGRTLVSGSFDNTMRLWDVSDPKNVKPLGGPLRGHEAGVYSVAFSPDGKTLASGSSDNTIRLWDVGDPKQPKPLGEPLREHENSVQSIAFSPDGKIFASGSSDWSVRLWDVSDPQNPKPISEPLALKNSVQSIAFSPDGKTLASASGNVLVDSNNTVLLWNVDSESWIALACHRTGRNLSRGEWRFNLPNMPYHVTCPEWPAGT